MEFRGERRCFELEIQRHGVVAMIGIPRAWGGGLLGRTDKGEKCKDEMTTLPTTVESKIDKHRLIMYVFAFNYRRKLIKSG